MKNIIKLLSILAFISFASTHSYSAETAKLLKTDWSFKGLFGKFDRGSLQRGYQVYTEVCAACHSMKYLSYRNLGEKGGPEFSEAEVKAIAASFEVTDGPNADGEMFMRPFENSMLKAWEKIRFMGRTGSKQLQRKYLSFSAS